MIQYRSSFLYSLVFILTTLISIDKEPNVYALYIQNNSENDSTDYYVEWSLEAVKSGKYSEALQLALKAKNLAIKHKRIDQEVDSYTNLGLIEYFRGSFNSSVNFYNKGLTIRKELKDSTGIGLSYRNLMIVHQKLGKFRESLTYGDSALSLLITGNNPKEIASIYNRKGNLQNLIGEHENSIINFKKAVSIWRSQRDSLRLSYVLTNISNAYFSLSDLKTAEEYALKSLELKSKIGTRSSLAVTSKSLGRIYTKLGEFEKARMFFARSDSLRKEVRIINRNAQSLLLNADSLRIIGDYDTAISIYEQTVPLMQELNPLDVLELHSKLIETYKLKEEIPPIGLINNERLLRDSINQLIIMGLDQPEFSVPEPLRPTPNGNSNYVIITAIMGGFFLVVLTYRMALHKKKEPQENKSIMNNKKYEYQIGLSYSRRNSTYVKRVAKFLKKNEITYFFDTDEKANLWGKDLYQHLSEVYSKKCCFCVVFLSEHYATSRWTKLELKSAQERAFNENREYILPVRFDRTEIPGLRNTTAYIDGNEISPESLGKLLLEKLSNELRED